MTETPHPYRVGDAHPSAHPPVDPLPDCDDLALALIVDRVEAALRGHDIPSSDLTLVIGETLFQVARLVRLGATVDLPELGLIRRQPMPGKTARVEFRPHPSLLREFPDVC
ncbi:MAG: hypothetical protein HC834_09635 [Rhodospirillales bacterium]|nr:hypothetical protein [Rhodospirillales bacterium]